jgi:hypothetical protein
VAPAAAFNLLLIFILIAICKFDTLFLRNLSNAVIELSLLLSFYLSNLVLWEATGISSFFATTSLYHISASSVIAARILLCLLSWIGRNQLCN